MPMTQPEHALAGPVLDRFRKPPPSVVFVVEGDEAVLDSSVAVLEGHGFKVHAYSSCETFLGERPHTAGGLLLLNAHFPGMSGLDLLEGLKEDNSLIPTVLISGRMTPEMRAETTRRHDVIATLEKPLKWPTLLDLIRSEFPAGTSR